ANDTFNAYPIRETGVEKRKIEGIPASLRHVAETNEVLYRRNRKELARFGDKVGPEGGCVLDVPFLGGTLAINHTREEAFTDEDIAILKQFAQVLSEAYRRLEDLRQMEEQTAQLNQRQKMEAIGELSGGIAHDFNNMLTAILTTCDLMMIDRPEDDKDRGDLDIIKRAGLQAAALTRQLLIFSRRQTVQPRIVDLNQVLSESLQMLRRVIGEHIELSTVLGANHCHIYMDLNQMEQIIMNLTINARDAMPDGGMLSIEVRQTKVAPGEIDIPAGDYAQLLVRDEGCGMDSEVRARLFEPFFTTKDTGRGTGMGLAIVYGAVQQNNGHIRVHSTPGEGATFKIWLPLVEHTPSDTNDAPIEDGVRGGTETILLVEDNEIVSKAAIRVLSGFGYTITETGNAEEALQFVESCSDSIDLVISDIVMPGMSGDKLAALLNERNPTLRILLMSGYTGDARMQNYPFLPKPFTPDDILRKVREVLDT
ncbi:MAG: two-component system cell cycle sensor histidine kinase/response regulator CckA, partial [Candidatus Latescibacterota bacterium]